MSLMQGRSAVAGMLAVMVVLSFSANRASAQCKNGSRSSVKPIASYGFSFPTMQQGSMGNGGGLGGGVIVGMSGGGGMGGMQNGGMGNGGMQNGGFQNVMQQQYFLYFNLQQQQNAAAIQELQMQNAWLLGMMQQLQQPNANGGNNGQFQQPMAQPPWGPFPGGR